MDREEPVLLMNSARIRRSIDRIAYQVAEEKEARSRILVLGIKERGFAVARLLADSLSSILHDEIKLLPMPLDEDGKPGFGDSDPGNPKKDVDYILIVDDVIFSGKTMLGAIQKISRAYNGSTLRTVVLIDRGHRRVPVGASFCGLKLPTKLNEHVSVQLNEGVPEKIILTNG